MRLAYETRRASRTTSAASPRFHQSDFAGSPTLLRSLLGFSFKSLLRMVVVAQHREKNNLGPLRRFGKRSLIWLEWWKHSQPSSAGRLMRLSSFVKSSRRLFAKRESPASASASLLDQFIHGRLLPQSSICTLTERRPARSRARFFLTN